MVYFISLFIPFLLVVFLFLSIRSLSSSQWVCVCVWFVCNFIVFVSIKAFHSSSLTLYAGATLQWIAFVCRLFMCWSEEFIRFNAMNEATRDANGLHLGSNLRRQCNEICHHWISHLANQFEIKLLQKKIGFSFIALLISSFFFNYCNDVNTEIYWACNWIQSLFCRVFHHALFSSIQAAPSNCTMNDKWQKFFELIWIARIVCELNRCFPTKKQRFDPENGINLPSMLMTIVRLTTITVICIAAKRAFNYTQLELAECQVKYQNNLASDYYSQSISPSRSDTIIRIKCTQRDIVALSEW